ncbi:MAG: PASTA domain-containing protein [Candidatus Neomarinimicrobiota bacterium]|nr:PASTA domain-containing protein [Candidatus Neomarinimicrobiota bacterium]|tara:strand:+ start:118 stop:873 length:756 start_codon:yes stop_codon:yes gene_type:complete
MSLIRTILSIIGMIVVFSIVAEYLIMPIYTRQNQNRIMIDIKNKHLDDAINILKSENYKYEVSDTLYTNKFQLGTIVDQYPKPNTRVKSGRTVRLKIAQPEKSVAIPNLIGQSRRSAELELNQMGLLIDTVYTEYNPEYPNGTIAWQYPKAGDRRKKGMGIQITVSKGMPPNFFQVPNLIGLSINQAKDLIFKSRLKVGKISYHQDQDLVPYTVLDQSIKNGTVLDASATINLVVSVLDIQDIFNNLNNEP